MNTYVIGLLPLEIIIVIIIFQRGNSLYTSESDVYRRQILTYKDGPRADRVKAQSFPRQSVPLMRKLSLLNKQALWPSPININSIR